MSGLRCPPRVERLEARLELNELIAWATSPLGLLVIGGGVAVLVGLEMLGYS